MFTITDVKDGVVTLADGQRVALATIRRAAEQDDVAMATAYGEIWRAVEAFIARRAAAAAAAAKAACPRHEGLPEKERDFCYTGPVAREENRRAHGNICRVETCRCGAMRRTNMNNFAQEVGGWE